MAPTVLVTGTSTGIGAACVERLARAGWTVLAGVRRRADGDLLADRVAGDVRPLIVDVTDEVQVQHAVDEVRAVVGGGGLDGLVNNAGIGLGGPVELVPMADWRRQFEVNVFGVIALTQAAFDLVRDGGGRFVYIGSQAGRVSNPGLAPYSASKHVLEALCESMRHELATTPMTVSLIEPGMVKTPIWDKSDEQIRRAQDLLAVSPRDEYGFLVPATRAFTREAAAKGIEPDRVARAVEHALTVARPKARYLVGPDAKALGTIVTRLPDPLRDRVIGALIRRYARLGTALERRAGAATFHGSPDPGRSSGRDPR